MKKLHIYILMGAAMLMTGCNFLDHEPDMRATIDTKEKVQLLLASGYSNANYGAICEMSSDNIVDNTYPDSRGQSFNVSSLSKMYDEMFAWQPVVSGSQQDSPYYIWQYCYKAIATANQALKAIESLEQQGVDLSAEKGEALLIRAYHHFVLANVFCQTYKDPSANKNEIGITYMTEPETNVAPKYDRGTLFTTYQNIEKDMLEGLELVSDEYYTVPKYRMNVKAAHAFAARYYLYTRQWSEVIKHANIVLGTTPGEAASMMFNANKAYNETSYPSSEVYVWHDTKDNSNLMLMTTMSSYFRTYGAGRHCLNRDAFDQTFRAGGPCWSNNFPGIKFWLYDQNYGCFCAKLYSYFEYTDKVAGIGYIHGIRREFTANETLLCRAEAKIYTNDIQGAIEDLSIWAQSYDVNKLYPMSGLDASGIERFYYNGKNKQLCPTLNTGKVSGTFNVTSAQMPYIWCVLHFRRIENIHEGLRWFDIKRYGIDVTHNIGGESKRVVHLQDYQRAIQLPVEVINCEVALEPNPGYNEKKPILAQ